MNDWREHAGCKGEPPSLFFDAATIPTATSICRTCPVTTDCAAYAAEQGITEGVWGGALQGVIHGSHTGYPRGCRCLACCATRHEVQERHRLRKKVARAKTLTDDERAEWAQIIELRRRDGAA